MKKDKNKYPLGFDRQKVHEIIAHYENQTEDEAVAEDEAAFCEKGQTMMQVQTDLVPAVLELIASRKKTA